jgi:hypothetical protein
VLTGSDATNAARVRINLAAQEVEIAGPQSFVESFSETVTRLIGEIGSAEPRRPQLDGPTREHDVPTHEGFGEALLRLSRSATDTDKILVAGYFAQEAVPNKTFSTSEANRLLTEQGIKLSNPSQSLKNNIVAKRVFKHQGKYRLSQQGIERARQLLSLP